MFLLIKITILAIIIINNLLHIEAHVRLTFPPGRKFALDFLDNQRTYGPCGGMPMGATKTRLTSGKSYAFSWRMGLLHQGNFQIELFNSTGKMLDLVNWDETKSAPIITQSRSIEIPENLTCINCTIRFLREAKEFSVQGNPYIFWSCADVDIVPLASIAPLASIGTLGEKWQCSENGRLILGQCYCDEGYSGKYCELPTECLKDTDCGNPDSGKCIKLSEIDKNTAGECFCKFPYFGHKCSNRVNSGSQTLQKFQADLQANLRKDQYQKIDLFRDQVTLYYRTINDTEPQIEFVLKSQSTSFIGLGWRPSGLTRKCKRHWPKKVGPSLRQERGIEEVFRAEVAEFAKNSAKINATLHQQLDTHEFGHAPFSAMDCTDLVISSVRGNYSRIRDYYTMDRSTPQPDPFWGGDDNINLATGWESESETTVVFRKPVYSSDPASVDHNLSGELHLIWSRGQIFPPNDVIYNRFYAKDEIKYHGYGPTQRGVVKARFF